MAEKKMRKSEPIKSKTERTKEGNVTTETHGPTRGAPKGWEVTRGPASPPPLVDDRHDRHGAST